MHLERCKSVLDACHLREGQHVLMATGRAAKVAVIDQTVIRFDYFERRGPDDYVIVPRHKVPELVRV
ncbi:hypothetical protein [Paludibacterium purpuratum]|uniref:Uncharacterized protein n=1 Tax=Paludibacterium purpuratum TaxID=1144873 RepID=A0A4R7BC05_9NEIS|nr:hypothetical protein [Paludibacterium purpuratum]TDR82193.1 hypothetical protein DFP86_102307 [Paludibacterium purpuratum]